MPTTTPLVWEETFNPVADPTGTQNTAKTIGLSNGNILVVWRDSNATTANGAGDDAVAQIHDPLGNPIGDPIYLNLSFGSALDIDDIAIAAKDDGGFSLAYQHNNPGATGDNGIIFMSFDDAGASVGTNLNIARENPDTSFGFADPQIVYRPDGSHLVVYEEFSSDGTRLLGRIVNSNGSVGSEFVVRNDNGTSTTDGNPVNPKLAVLDDGVTTVAVYQELDGTDYDIEFQFISSNGTVSDLTEVTSNTDLDREPDVAALTSGGFVVVWERNGDIYGRIYDTNGDPEGAEIALATGGDNQNEPQVIGLPDGGFFLVWDDDTDSTLEGKRFDSNGNTVGSRIDIMDVDTTRPDVALTGDGRILVAGDSFGDVFLTILDPRDEAFTVTDGSVTVAARGGSEIDGSDAKDTFYGVEGNDDFSGKKGNDSLFGGQGNDEISGGKGRDLIKGGKGNDDLFGDIGDDEIQGDRGRDDIFGGDDDDMLFGGDGGDRVSGQSGKDTIEGGAKNDDLFGGGGNDEIKGGKGQDVIVGGKGRDEMSGDNGADIFVFTAANQSRKGSDNRDTITDFTHTVDRIDLSAIDADTTTGGNQAFAFIGSAGFSDAGQLRAKVSGSDIILQADRDGDGTADMEIRLTGPVTVDTNDFIL